MLFVAINKRSYHHFEVRQKKVVVVCSESCRFQQGVHRGWSRGGIEGGGERERGRAWRYGGDSSWYGEGVRGIGGKRRRYWRDVRVGGGRGYKLAWGERSKKGRRRDGVEVKEEGWGR